VSDWVTIAFTTLGAGAVGAIITTYGTQIKDRRATRAKARDSLRRVERATNRATLITHPVMVAALDDLDTCAMLAGLPEGLVNFHREATMRYWVKITSAAPAINGNIQLPSAETLTAGRVSHQAAKLLASATWHPWRSMPYRVWRLRRLRKIMQAGMPARAQMDQRTRGNLRNWEREILRTTKDMRADLANDPDWTELRNVLREDP
jgi:hypothetical protein